MDRGPSTSLLRSAWLTMLQKMAASVVRHGDDSDFMLLVLCPQHPLLSLGEADLCIQYVVDAVFKARQAAARRMNRLVNGLPSRPDINMVTGDS